ncbi:hypothetical protein KDW_59120 [Dictyobacter vulcani]|uniref:Alpha/beta hydrolase n=1 Tax=Dictyobacter vulcani TaxID=2607529 RepID=A0A5J4KYZ4_9CHLR|nr:hypothetical protein [Dictyobacter vulcani]GER91750.1 hypothetical protein KDW_59120 [Dictyobacter vulcani]
MGGRRLRKRWVVARTLLLLLFVLGFCASVFPGGRSLVRAAYILPALIAATQPGALVAGGEPIKHSQLTISASSGPVYLDVYAPDSPEPVFGRARSGVLVVPGVGDNRQVPQLVNLLEALARTGVVVMSMTTPTLMAYDVSVQDTDATVLAFEKLQSLPGMQGRRSGMIAFSAGVPLTSFASADARIRDQVAYMAAFGGYFDTRTLLQTFGRRSITIDGKRESWLPIDIPIEVLTNMTTKNFSTSDQDMIRTALAPKAQPLSASELATMSIGAQDVYHLLKGDTPTQVDNELRSLPPDLEQLLDELAPRRVIKDIHAPIFLLHDRNDASLPVTETRAFDIELTRLQHSHEYVEFHIFDHVEMRSGLNIGQLIGDGTHLFSILNDLLYAAS